MTLAAPAVVQTVSVYQRLQTVVTPDLINANGPPPQPKPLTENDIREQIYHENL